LSLLWRAYKNKAPHDFVIANIIMDGCFVALDIKYSYTACKQQRRTKNKLDENYSLIIPGKKYRLYSNGRGLHFARS